MTDQLFMRFTNVHFGAIVDHLEKIFPTLPPIAWVGGGKPSLMFLGATNLVAVRNAYSAEYVFRDKNSGGALLYVEIRESQIDTASLLVAWTNTTLRHAKELIVHLCIETGNPIPPKLAQMPYPPMKTMRKLGAIEYLKPDVFPVAAFELGEVERQRDEIEATAAQSAPPSLATMTPTGRNGNYSDQDWRQLFEAIQKQGLVNPNYEEIGRTYGRSRRYVKNKWNDYRNGVF